MRRLGAFTAGAVTAFTVGLIVVEWWIHFMEHTAYTKAAR
jgi:undecaprenyl pyrophosphate phosphatase UppP